MPSDHAPSSQQTAWQASVAKLLNGADIQSLVARSRDGIAIGPLYAKAEAVPAHARRDTARPFRIIQRVDHPEMSVASRLALTDVENGANGLAVVFATASSARGFGIHANSADDLAFLLDGLPLDTLALRFDLPCRAARPTLDVLTGFARHRHDPSRHDIDIGFDPLGDVARTGEPDPDLTHRAATVVGALRVHGLTSPILRADGRLYHEAGASEAQELAAVLATAASYLRALEAQGLEAARHTLSFTLVADADQFLTIAKLRALRRLWARVEQACGLVPKPIRLHAETAWRMLTRRDPPTNLLRNTIAASAAILGGADSLTVLPHTSALGLPDDFARRLARNTPLVLLEEAHLGRVADPAAGSGGFEALTDALCEEAWRLFQDLERDGGLARALQEGTWQAKLAQTRAAREADVQDGTAVIVGVTKFMLADQLTLEGPVRGDVEAALSPLALPSRRDAEIFETLR